MNLLQKILISLISILPVYAQAQDKWPLHSFKDRRFKENWELSDWEIRDKSARNWADKIKNVPITQNRKMWLTLGGQARIRYMGTINEEFVKKNTGLFTLRMRTHADFHLGKHFRVYGEGIYSNTTNDDSERLGTGTPVTRGAFLNLFAEANLPLSEKIKAGVWFGRRELQTGHERIVSPGNWLTTRRSWEGGGFFIGNDVKRVSGFITRPLIVVPDGFTTRDAETVFWGIKYQSNEPRISSNAGFGVQSWSSLKAFHFEPYFFGINRKNVIFEQGVEDEKRYTFGLLLSGPLYYGILDYQFEGIYQFGNFGNADVRAFSLTGEFGVSPPGIFWNLHFWAGFDYSSGDSDPSDNKLETFDPLYPQAAQWFGEHGAIDRKNLISTSLNIDFTPLKLITSRFTYWKFSRASKMDAVYNTSNGILRASGNSNQRDLGHSFQLSNVLSPGYQWEFTFTYNFWKPGKFFRETQGTTALTQHFLMITAQFTF